MKNLPKEFLEQLESLGHDAYLRLPEVIGAAAPEVSVRINPWRNPTRMVPFEGALPVAWNNDGFYLAERPAFTLDPRLHQGLYYVQEASSMAVRAAVKCAAVQLDLNRPLRYLDACAAPGGKTTAAIDVLPDDAFVVANEYDSRRAQILVENLAKWGAEAFVTRGDAAKLPFPDDFFDIIAADVPCSGEGMMRKDPFAIEQWSPSLVGECAVRQRRIVDRLWQSLRPGGFMIYSTCTFNLAENEEIVDYICTDLGGDPVEISMAADGILGAMGGYEFPVYRFVPGEIGGEGLFMAMLRKPGYSIARQIKVSKPVRPTAHLGQINISDILSGDYVLLNEPLRAVRAEHFPVYEVLAKAVRPISAGVEIGTVKGRDFIPSQALALSRHFMRGYYPEVEVGYDMAISYLRHEALALPSDSPHGIVLLIYEGHPLGWVKNLGNRANNLYPDLWRIRTC